MNKILSILGIIGMLFFAVIIFGISVMGDRSCKIQIQNSGQQQLIIKTYQFTNYDKKLTVDSVVLSRNEKFDIGHCINCSIPDTLDIDFDAIGIYGSEGALKIMDRSALITYLETLEKEDCITYIVP